MLSSELSRRVVRVVLLVAVASGSAMVAMAEDLGAATGSDVVAFDLFDTYKWGAAGTLTAYSVGTESCNRGTTPVDWYSATSKHPVIAQNLYRLKDGRFEQVGMSWLKHGFSSLNQNDCGTCVNPPGGGAQLGVGCSDPYWASLNGSQSRLGPRSEVNGFTGDFPADYTAPTGNGTLAGRGGVAPADVVAASNPGALYFVEGQYVASDDAEDGNSLNNASYRRVTVDGSNNLVVQGSTFEGLPAIYAWADTQAGVEVTAIDVPGEGRFHVASAVTDNLDGTWRYDYAVHNLNSHRSAASLVVPVGVGTVVTEVGFHDVDYHSGEPYSLTDWPASVAADAVSWATTPYATDANANALRWGTMYSFWFTADQPPQASAATLGLFRDGAPAALDAAVIAPAAATPLFADGFESGDVLGWSSSAGS